jgi:hypothetical protein
LCGAFDGALEALICWRKDMRRSSVVCRSVLAGLIVGCSALVAHGQAGQPQSKIEPPGVTGKSEEGQAWGIFAVFVLMLVVVGAAIVPTKRGHQD